MARKSALRSHRSRRRALALSAALAGAAAVAPTAAAAPPGTLVPCPSYPPSADPKCAVTGKSRSVGAGPAFPGPADGVGAGIQGGFVDAAAGRLVVAGGGVLKEGVKQGFVMTVDLASGNRTFVSGTLNDPAEGPKQRGRGPELSGQDVFVAPGPGGWYAVSDLNVSAKPGQPKGVLKIDPATGDRSWAVDFAGPAFKAGPCASLNRNLAVAPNGKIYIPFINIDIGKGVAEITPGATPAAAQCRAVVNNKGPVGSGAKPDDPWSVGFAAGKLWVFDKRGGYVVAVNPADGASRRVTAKNGSVGEGDKCLGVDGFAVTDSIIWTYSSDGPTGCTGVPRVVSVDPATGARATGGGIANGPAAGTVVAAFVLPGQKDKVLYAEKSRVLVYDMKKGLVNNFSY
jgi:hypothetical protein